MFVRKETIPEIYDIPDVQIICECKEIIHVSRHLHKLWESSGIKFKCPKCNNFILLKRK
jgi:hypothetical protein